MQEMHYTTMHYNAPCIILNKTTGFLLLHQRLLSLPPFAFSLFFSLLLPGPNPRLPIRPDRPVNRRAS